MGKGKMSFATHDAYGHPVFKYVLDFEKMTQTNQTTWTQRVVCRRPDHLVTKDEVTLINTFRFVAVKENSIVKAVCPWTVSAFYTKVHLWSAKFTNARSYGRILFVLDQTFSQQGQIQ